ncbi:uncharacterized protein BJ171DRAFT_498474 [Polychytrium aggregatum]|uniref:uncharacterized protein n=1 Tax=Polychytrium aggregatum TaxID=110093 RepID=UPI0022FE28D5|nr:uncharacterized protein BJ171DRAFT_498474 [Polychytrium aggregatum]KAI9206044.1 hypothetical protein BJ171DRAFT_498474 [Polychytrium aggregatum]
MDDRLAKLPWQTIRSCTRTDSGERLRLHLKAHFAQDEFVLLATDLCDWWHTRYDADRVATDVDVYAKELASTDMKDLFLLLKNLLQPADPDGTQHSITIADHGHLLVEAKGHVDRERLLPIEFTFRLDRLDSSTDPRLGDMVTTHVTLPLMLMADEYRLRSQRLRGMLREYARELRDLQDIVARQGIRAPGSFDVNASDLDDPEAPSETDPVDPRTHPENIMKFFRGDESLYQSCLARIQDSSTTTATGQIDRLRSLERDIDLGAPSRGPRNGPSSQQETWTFDSLSMFQTMETASLQSQRSALVNEDRQANSTTGAPAEPPKPAAATKPKRTVVDLETLQRRAEEAAQSQAKRPKKLV